MNKWTTLDTYENYFKTYMEALVDYDFLNQ